MNKKFLIYIGLAIVIGGILGNLFYKKYENERSLEKEYNSYLLQLGIFDTKEDMNKELLEIDDYIVIEKNNKYYVYVGVSTNKKNATKLQEIFLDKDINTSIKKTIISDIEFMNSLEQFDLLLDSVSSNEDIMSINEAILSSYEEMVLNS